MTATTAAASVSPVASAADMESAATMSSPTSPRLRLPTISLTSVARTGTTPSDQTMAASSVRSAKCRPSPARSPPSATAISATFQPSPGARSICRPLLPPAPPAGRSLPGGRIIARPRSAVESPECARALVPHLPAAPSRRTGPAATQPGNSRRTCPAPKHNRRCGPRPFLPSSARQRRAEGPHETDPRPQRTQPQPSRHPPAGDLRARNARRCRGALRIDRGGEGALRHLPAVESRVRTDRLGAGGAERKRRHRHQPRRLQPYLGRPPRRAQRLRRAGDRGPPLEHPPARGLPPPFLRLHPRRGGDRRRGRAGLRLRRRTRSTAPEGIRRMDMPRNRFKARLVAGELQFGLWSTIPEPTAVEALAGAGFDWMVLDTEHTAVEVAAVLPLLQAMAPWPTAPVVRPSVNDTALIKRHLDQGAQTLLIPYIQS